MNFANILNEFTGNATGDQHQSVTSSMGNTARSIAQNIPGGLAGGAVAGGLVAMLVGSKSARKTAGKAAKYGGAAMLGGLAYRAYQGWQQNNAANNVTNNAATPPQPTSSGQLQTMNVANQGTLASDTFEQEALAHMNGAEPSQRLQIALIKAMIAAARADGQIDADEQHKISAAIKKMHIDSQAKSELLELFLEPVAIKDFVGDLDTMEQKAEVYLASCFAINLDHEAEYAHLSELSAALQLPPGLEQQLRAKASDALSAQA